MDDSRLAVEVASRRYSHPVSGLSGMAVGRRGTRASPSPV